VIGLPQDSRARGASCRRRQPPPRIAVSRKAEGPARRENGVRLPAKTASALGATVGGTYVVRLANVVFGGTVAGSTGVSNDEQGVAGALVNAARQMGGAIGVAVVLSVVALDAGVPAAGANHAAGCRLALACWAGMATVAAVVSLALPSRRRPDPECPPKPARVALGEA